MHTIETIVLETDIHRLQKDTLVEICKNYGLSTEGNASELAHRIWRLIGDDPELKKEALKPYRDELFCYPRLSVTWFQLPKQLHLFDIKERIIANSGFNPFEKMLLKESEDVPLYPILSCAAPGKKDGEYYLRFLFQGIIERNTSGAYEFRPKASLLYTVLIDEENQLIEIRAPSNLINDITRSLERLLGYNEKSLLQINISESPFGSNIEKITNLLNGWMFKTKVKPFSRSDITEMEQQAIVQTLKAINSYFVEGDIEKLQSELDEAKTLLGDLLLGHSFSSLLINGLDAVGIQVTDSEDVRKTVLYQFFKDDMEAQGGYIRFPFDYNGKKEHHTIQVGLTTKSVVFLSKPTEQVIQYVRNHVIMGVLEGKA